MFKKATQGVNHKLLWPALILLVTITTISVIIPNEFVGALLVVQKISISYLGGTASLVSLLCVLTVLAVYFSPLGKIKLGGKDAKPMMNKWNWFAIALCTTIATGCVYWGIVQPILHVNEPPVMWDVEPNSPQAIVKTMATIFLQWTAQPYAIYALPALVFAFVYFNMKQPYGIVSTLTPVLGEHRCRKWFTPISSVLLFVNVCAMCASLAQGMFNLSGAAKYLLNWDTTTTLLIGIGCIFVIPAIISSISGILSGIKILSDLNMRLYVINPEDYKPYNITRENLFDLVMPGEQLGTVTHEAALATGFPEGCPVIATANDKAAEGLGAGIIDDSTCLISLGTYIGGMVNGHEFNDSATHYWSNLSAIPHRYLYEGMKGIRRGMWSVSWFKEVMGPPWAEKAKAEGLSVEQLLEREALPVPAGSDGLITVPEFLSPNDMPYRKAMMIGFDGRHKRGHMYRSILESIAMTMHISMTNMFEEMGYRPQRLIVSGGGSKSDLFMQIFADVFGMDSVRNEITDAAGIGAAVCAAVGVGAYPDYETAVANMVRIQDGFKPNLENTALYQKVEDTVYRNIKDYSDPVNKKIYSLFG